MPVVAGVGGLTFGADPIAVAAAFASELMGQPIQAFSIRKTQKDHGIVRWIEGDLKPGQRVAVIDDVATTGGSTIKAIERAREERPQWVVRAVVLVDRQEGGLANIRKHIADTRGRHHPRRPHGRHRKNRPPRKNSTPVAASGPDKDGEAAKKTKTRSDQAAVGFFYQAEKLR